MAGYFIYSVDWNAFHQLVTKPTDAHVEALAESLDDRYERAIEGMEEEEEDDTLAKSWSSEGENPQEAIRKHLSKSDWYSGLGDYTKRIWSSAIEDLLQDAMEDEFGFRVDSDGIYWDLIELATRKLGNKSDQCAVARFGRCPYSCAAIEAHEPEEWGFQWWDPYHSMHPPDEVKQLIEEFESLSETVQSSNNEHAIRDFEELMPALESIAKENRMLYIAVDT